MNQLFYYLFVIYDKSTRNLPYQNIKDDVKNLQLSKKNLLTPDPQKRLI